MALFGSSNPFMKEEKFHDVLDAPLTSEGSMTVAGAVNKTFILTGLLLLTSAISYMMPNFIFMIVGAIGGLIAALVAAFKPRLSNYLAPTYALFEGLFIGTISSIYAAAYSGIVINAFISTIGILVAMLFIYKSRIIEVTEKFRVGVMAATGAVALLYLVSMVLRLFGVTIPFIHEGGMMGIGFSLLVIGIATMNLLLDFDNIEKGAQYSAPKYMEWYSAMGLLITLVWLYLEMLRLLSKIARSR
jgi:uncharacterized YccA/Bax inhibitor family protein